MFLAAVHAARAQFTCAANASGTITITGYARTSIVVSIPSVIGGLAVTEIGTNAFLSNDLASVTIPQSVTSLGSGSGAFESCEFLASVTISINGTALTAYLPKAPEKSDRSITKTINIITPRTANSMPNRDLA